MNNAEQIIYQYEMARQEVSKLKRERLDLITQCESVDTCDGLHGEIVSIGTLCLVGAWNEMHKMNNENDDSYGYAEVLHEVGCDSCIESYRIKTEPLAVARQEFGKIKRRLSYMGKKLAKGIDGAIAS